MEEKNKGTLIIGPIDTQYPSDTYPTHISRKGRGGPFQANSLEEMLSISVSRLFPECKCTVSEDLVNSRPRITYVLKKLPLENIDNPSEVVLEHPDFDSAANYRAIKLTTDQNNEGFYLNFWLIDNQAKGFDGQYEEQYAPDYDGTYYSGNNLITNKQPPFPYSLDQTWNDDNWTGQISTEHKWQRHRYGTGKWSSPYRIFGKYRPGDVIDERYQWKLTQDGAPALPAMMKVDGVSLNNEPTGWDDGTANKPAGAYTLWKILGEKDVYGNLKGPWRGPFEVALDANLLRFSKSGVPDPNGLVTTSDSAAIGTAGDTALIGAGWVMEPKKEHYYKAARKDNGDGTYTKWETEKYVGESGRYMDRMYRNFPTKLVDYILQNPDEVWTVADGGDSKPFRPTEAEPEGWTDKESAVVPDDETVFEISAWKYNNGELVSGWADPVPKSRKDVIISVITADKGYDFRYDPNAATPRQVTDIALTASLYRGVTLLNITEAGSITYQWKRIFNGGVADDTVLGTQRIQNINHSLVDGKAVFQVQQTLSDGKGNNQVFTTEEELLDIADGNNARTIALRTDSGLFTRKSGTTTPSQTKLRAYPLNLTYGANDFVWEYRTQSVDEVDGAWTALADNTKEVVISNSDFLDHLALNESYVKYRVRLTDTVTSTVFEDYQTIHFQDIVDGQAEYTVILSNEFYNLPVNPDGSLVNGLTNAFTKWTIIQNGSDVTASFDSVTVNTTKASADPGVSDNVVATLDIPNAKVSVTTWEVNVKEAQFELVFTGTSLPTIKYSFKVRRSVGFETFFAVAIDSDSSGFTFKPGDTADKILTAKVYLNQVLQADLSDFTFSWSGEGGLSGTASTLTVGVDDVDVRNSIVLTVTQTSTGNTAQARVDVVEVQDAVSLDVLYYPDGAKPAKPTLDYDQYEPLDSQITQGAVSQGVIDWLDIPVGAPNLIGLNILLRDDGGTSWQIWLDSTLTGITADNVFTEDVLYDAIDLSATGITRIGVAPVNDADANSYVEMLITPYTGESWITKIAYNSVWKTEKRSNEPASAWSDPYRFVGEKGEASKGAFFPTYLCISAPNSTVTAPNTSISPLDSGVLKTTFTDNHGRTWYAEDQLPSNYNPFSTTIWSSSVRVDVELDGTYTSNNEWTNPRRIGGTDGIPGEQTIFIWRRSKTKPANAVLPINNLELKEYGGPNWFGTQPSGSDTLWMCFAKFSYDIFDRKFKQAANWSAPEQFNSTPSKMAVAYHDETTNNDPPLPPTDSKNNWVNNPNHENGSWYNRLIGKTPGWKAEAYLNDNVWTSWQVTRIKGGNGDDGTKWYSYSQLSVSSEAGNKLDWFISQDGRTGDYAIKKSGEIYKKINVPSGLWSREFRMGEMWYAYEELNATNVQSTFFNSTVGIPGDKTFKPDGAIYEKEYGQNKWIKIGQLQVTANNWWADHGAYRIKGSNGSPDFESWDLWFGKDPAGIVHYAFKWYRNGGGNVLKKFEINEPWATRLRPLTMSLSAGVSAREFVFMPRLVNVINNQISPTVTTECRITFDPNTGKLILTLKFHDDHAAIASGTYPGDTSGLLESASNMQPKIVT